MKNALSVWGPFAESMNDLIGLAGDFERSFADLAPTNRHYLNVIVDVDEKDNYVIKAEVPGIKEEDLDVSYENGIVTITAEYKEEGKNVFRKGKYARSFRLLDVDAEKTEATLKDGILTVVMPKAEDRKSRKIKIN